MPGDSLLHPIVLVSLVVLVLNDHWFKAAAPGLITGKLSDVAGLTVFPVMALAIWEFVGSRVGRPAPAGVRAISIATGVTAIGFAAVKIAPPATELFGIVLGLCQWLAGMPGMLLGQGAAGSPIPTQAWTDPTDLLALPAIGVAWWIARRRALGTPAQMATGRHLALLAGRLRTAGAVVVLMAAGFATIATEPAPATFPPSTAQSFPASFALSAATPVAVRDLTITVDPAGLAPSGSSLVELRMNQPGLRVFAGKEAPTAIPDGSSAMFAGPSQVDPTAIGYPIWTLPDGVTTATVRLIVELADLSLAPLTASGQLVVTTLSGAGSVPSPAHVEIRGLDGGSLPPPGQTAAERTGVVTLDAEQPIVSERFAVQVEPGTLTDPAALVLDESLVANLDTQGAEVKVVVANDVPNPGYQGRFESGPNGTKSNLRAAIPNHVPCATNAPCTFAYVVSFEYAGDATVPAQLHWDFRVALADYLHAQPPADRQVSVAETTTATPAHSAQGANYSISGRTLFAAGSQQSFAEVLVDPGTTGPATAGGVCALTGTVSFSAIDVTSAETTTAFSAQLGTSIPPYRASLQFTPDGQMRTLGFGHVEPCFVQDALGYALTLGFQMPDFPASSPSSLVVNWTANLVLTSLAGGPPPAGTTLTLRPDAGANTTFAPPY